jgi:hypothetical protein
MHALHSASIIMMMRTLRLEAAHAPGRTQAEPPPLRLSCNLRSSSSCRLPTGSCPTSSERLGLWGRHGPKLSATFCRGGPGGSFGALRSGMRRLAATLKEPRQRQLVEAQLS